MNTTPILDRATDGQWHEQLDAVRAELSALDRRLRRAARTQPLTVIAGALAAGFLLGRLLRR
ncbi:hypothetical protein KF840_04505 [bacterium]|nr:hypothetical protein [bacterium]